MNNIETLKQELIEQKTIIERKYGIVTIKGTNPSPSEITEGIRTIPSTDLSNATATEADVMLGKTFYAGDAGLKTGTAQMNPNLMNHLFMVNANTRTTEDEIYYYCPEGLTQIRTRCFYGNLNTIHITFNPELKEIGSYSFYNCKNMTFSNLENITELLNIGNYSFANSGGRGLVLEIPPKVTLIETSAFENAITPYTDIIFNSVMTNLGSDVFCQTYRTVMNTLNMANTKIKAFQADVFRNVAFNCDLIFPSTATSIGANFNYGGCFQNITIPGSVTTLSNTCFYAPTASPLSNFYLETVTFERETPPTIGTTIFAQQHKTNNFKIYVPDNALEAYKAVANLSTYVDYIYPMSQKD